MTSDSLGRYYTDSSISNLLVRSLQASSASVIIDIGVGEGSLARAALNRYSAAYLVTADIEKKRKSIVIADPSRVKFHHIDGLCTNISRRINIKVGQVDIAICNPPYKRIKMQSKHRKILKSAGFKNLATRELVTMDILFLAQNLHLLKENGEIGIILPDTLLSGTRFEHFRFDLLSVAKIVQVIQLPIRVFSKETEASTHILLLRKAKTKSDYSVPISLSDLRGEILDTVYVNSSSLLFRMDFQFHKNGVNTHDKFPTLAELGGEIFRGKHSKKHLESLLGIGKFFHLCDFRNRADDLDSLNFRSMQVSTLYAQKGDILFARIGKRGLGRVAFVGSGKITISDCIFVIRLPKYMQQIVFQYLQSSVAQSYIIANSSGVCSRFITMGNLLRIPIIDIRLHNLS